MPLVFAGIAPHGFTIIPDLSDDAEGALVTRASMHELGRRSQDAGVEVVILAGPHGFRIHGAICLADVARGAGSLTWEGRTIEQNVPIDAALTDALAEAGRSIGVPVAMAGFGGNRPDQGSIPLDWGMITPLWFLGHDRNMVGHGDVLSPWPKEDKGPAAVIMTPSRALSREQLISFGGALAEACEKDPRKIAFIASCDWGHCHRDDGPYGFHEASARIDAIVVDAVKRNDLGALMAITDRDASDSAIDGLWQTLILHGALQRVPMDVELLSYEAPTYYGMLVATWTPKGGAA